MSGSTSIEWTDATWNPVRGCTRVSPGCVHCYAETMAARFSDPGQWGHGFAKRTKAGGRWTGRVAVIREKLDEPQRWRDSRRVFVNSTSDLFHEGLMRETIADVYRAMGAADWHTFQVLTKRPERRRALFEQWSAADPSWPMPHIWEGTSIESADYLGRLEHLRQTPAAVRFLSLEPLLGPLPDLDLCGIHWVIVGGESGPGARPMHPDWAREIRDQCQDQGVAFFFKQWGAWCPYSQLPEAEAVALDASGSQLFSEPPPGDGEPLRLSKGRAGALLDDREWHEFPQPQIKEVPCVT